MWPLQLVVGVLFVCVTLTDAEPHPVMEECRRIDSCRCQAESGIIDLSPLDSKNYLEPAFKDIPSVTPNDTDKFSWNPCTPFCEVHCEGAAMCQLDQGLHSLTYPIGDVATNQFRQSYSEHGTHLVIDGLVVEYVHHPNGRTRTSIVKLMCDELAEESILIPFGEIHPLLYYFELVSKYACLQESIYPIVSRPPPTVTCPKPWDTTTTPVPSTPKTTTAPSTSTERPQQFTGTWTVVFWFSIGFLCAVGVMLLGFVAGLLMKAANRSSSPGYYNNNKEVEAKQQLIKTIA